MAAIQDVVVLLEVVFRRTGVTGSYRYSDVVSWVLVSRISNANLIRNKQVRHSDENLKLRLRFSKIIKL